MESDWRTATVAELQRQRILLVEDGNHGEYRPRPDEFTSLGPAFIRAADLDAGRVLFESASKINERARQRITKGIGAPGDILLSHKGTVGKVALVPKDAPPFVCSPQTTFWRTLNVELLDRQYLYAFMRSAQFHAQLATRAGETDMAPYVSLTSQRGLSVTLPPIGIQRAIAGVLGTIDDKIDLLWQMNETLETMARAIFQDWFVDFGPTRAKVEGGDPYLAPGLWGLFPDTLDGEDKPAGWRKGELREIVELNPKEPLPGGTVAPYLEMSALPTSGSIPDAPIDREFTAGMRFRNGDTLLARITPCLENGKTAFIQQLPRGAVGWGSTEFIVMRPTPPVPAPFAYILARDPTFRGLAIQSMTGTSGRQRARTEVLAQHLVAIPDDAIWNAFGSTVDPIFERIKVTSDEIRTLARVRDRLLPKLMSGEIRLGEGEKMKQVS